MFEEELKDLGLTDNEVRIYVLLLKLGSLSPALIAAKASMHRPSVYDCLERMLEKGVVSIATYEGKRRYSAVQPETLIELLKYKVEAMQNILPSLKKLAVSTEENAQVEMFYGRRAYRSLLRDLTASARDGEIVMIMGVEEEKLLEEIEPIYIRQYFTIIKERKIHEQNIIAKGSMGITHPNVTYREIDEKYIGNVSHIIYANKVAFFIQSVPYVLIIINNKDLAKTMRNQFSFFWEHAQSVTITKKSGKVVK